MTLHKAQKLDVQKLCKSIAPHVHCHQEQIPKYEPYNVEEMWAVLFLACQYVQVAAILLSLGAVEPIVRRGRALGKYLHSGLPADASVQHYMSQPVHERYTIHSTQHAYTIHVDTQHFTHYAHMVVALFKLLHLNTS